MGELAEFILKVVDKKLSITPLPATPGSPRRRCPDMSKTKELTGYRAQVDLERGIEATFHWYRDNIFVQPQTEKAETV